MKTDLLRICFLPNQADKFPNESCALLRQHSINKLLGCVGKTCHWYKVYRELKRLRPKNQNNSNLNNQDFY